MNDKKSSQKSLLKSTGIVAIGQVVSILVGIVRTKFVAILLGPVGVGLIGFYQNIIDLIRTTTGLGVNFSGVKEVAQAEATADGNKVARVRKILLRLALATGIFGMLVMAVFSKQISQYTFSNTKETKNIVMLSVCILFSAVSSAQLAFMQGVRQLAVMTKASIASVVVTLFTSIPLFYWFKTNGIVPSLILSAFASLAVTFFFSQKLKREKVTVGFKETYEHSKSMIALGFFTVIASIVGFGTMYWVRSYILKQEGWEAVGYFNAAWTIGSMYLMLVLNAMGTDYFPRLSGIIHDHKTVRELVNNQTEIALLVGGTIIVGFLAYQDLAINIMYSSKFAPTENILKWILVGDFFKLLSWPIGYILLAKGQGKTFVITEMIWNGIFALITYLLTPRVGVQAIGIAYGTGYIVYLVIVFFIVNRLILIRFNKKLVFLALFYLTGIISMLVIHEYITSPIIKYGISTLFAVSVSVFSIKKLNGYLDFASILQKIKSR